MADTKTKTKAAMLHELESIKGLLLEGDNIPILQEVMDSEAAMELNLQEQDVSVQATSAKIIVEEQQDFFDSLPQTELSIHDESASELLNTIDEFEKHTAELTANKLVADAHKTILARPNLAKATGENPFLPAHIRSRLHGNNPPPLFAQETARKIAGSSLPSRLLGNTFTTNQHSKTLSSHDEIIDNLIEKFMPEIEKELRIKLEALSKAQLDNLAR
jgi:hypothetical protein